MSQKFSVGLFKNLLSFLNFVSKFLGVLRPCSPNKEPPLLCARYTGSYSDYRDNDVTEIFTVFTLCSIKQAQRATAWRKINGCGWIYHFWFTVRRSSFSVPELEFSYTDWRPFPIPIPPCDKWNKASIRHGLSFCHGIHGIERFFRIWQWKWNVSQTPYHSHHTLLGCIFNTLSFAPQLARMYLKHPIIPTTPC
jgi:hypothetical protein